MDIFNSATIQDLLLLAEQGENSNPHPPEPTFTTKLLSAKVLVDRWENVVSDILIHESNKDYVVSELKKNIYFTHDGIMTIWGANIHFVNNISKDKVLVVSLTDDDELLGDVPSRSVSTFII